MLRIRGVIKEFRSVSLIAETCCAWWPAMLLSYGRSVAMGDPIYRPRRRVRGFYRCSHSSGATVTVGLRVGALGRVLDLTPQPQGERYLLSLCIAQGNI
jgi:hypothetical protein